jgi:hypothetical protein
MTCISLNGLNHSVWNALLILAVPSAVIFLLAFFSLKKGAYYIFDPKHNNHPTLRAEGRDFEPHSKRYNDLARLLITLSAGIVAFIVNTLAGGGEHPSRYWGKIESTAPIVVGFFGASIALLILFSVLQAYWYEQYCHWPNHNSYSRLKYAICISLGFTGLLAFGIGVFWFAVNIFS